MNNDHTENLTIRRYGVYAAVFLKKADSAGVFPSDEHVQKATDLIFGFANAMEKAASNKSQIVSKCSCMLKQLWHRRKQEAKNGTPASPQPKPSLAGNTRAPSTSDDLYMASFSQQDVADGSTSGQESFTGEGRVLGLDPADLGQFASAIPLDESILESFPLDFDFLSGGDFEEFASAPLNDIEW